MEGGGRVKMEEGRRISSGSVPADKKNEGVTALVVVACIIAATGGLIFGYDNGISGGVTSMDPFLRKFFPDIYKKMQLPPDSHTNAYCKFDSQILTTFTSSLFIAGLLATFVASHVTRAYGRKPSIFLGGVSVLIGAALNGGAVNVAMLIVGRIMLGIGIGFADQIIIAVILGYKFESSGDGSISKGYAYLVVVLICIYVVGFAWSWGPLGWLVPSEILPLEIRSIGQSIAVSVNLLFIFAIAQGFLAMLCHFKFFIFIFFAGWVFIMTLFVYFFLPETKNVGIEEMKNVWNEHWFWKQFFIEELSRPKEISLS